MSSTTSFTLDKDLDKVVKAIIDGSKHPALNPIREQELKITPVLKIRTNKDGEHEQNPGAPAKIIKVNDMWKLFTDAHYILVMDYYCFNHASETARDAIIFNALCEVEVKAKEGEIKLATKKPDLQIFTATIQEYGAYDDILIGLKQWMNDAQTKAAKSFAAKVASGKLQETAPTEPPEEPPVDEDPPRVHAGAPPEEPAQSSRRGGRSRR